MTYDRHISVTHTVRKPCPGFQVLLLYTLVQHVSPVLLCCTAFNPCST
jgi:hypothetical protein